MHSDQQRDLVLVQLPNLENHLVGLVSIPEREPGTKVGFQIRNSLNSFDQLSVKGLLVVLLELWQVLGRLKDKEIPLVMEHSCIESMVQQQGCISMYKAMYTSPSVSKSSPSVFFTFFFFSLVKYLSSNFSTLTPDISTFVEVAMT
jgi:hypothetical protein